MQVLLLGGNVQRDQRRVEIAARVKVRVFVFKVHRIADAPHVEGRSLSFQKIGDDAFPAHDAHARLVRKHGADHFHARLGGEHTPLLLVFRNGDDDLVEERKALAHRIFMPDGKRVERTRKHTFFHRLPRVFHTIRKKATFVLP